MSRWERLRRLPAPVVDAGIIAVAAADIWIGLYDDGLTGLLVGVVACAALGLRRRFPLVAFLLTVPAGVTQDAVVAPFVALYTLAVTARDRRLLAACATLSAVAAVVPSPLSDEPSWDAGMVVAFAYRLALAGAPVLLGQLVRTRHELSRRIVEIHEAREHERLLHARTVLAQERARLAREMHDVVSHQVSLIAVQAGVLQVTAGEPGTREAARTIRELSAGTLDELRTMVSVLRGDGDDGAALAPQPTLADLPALVGASGLDVKLTGEITVAVASPVQRAVYRTVQEALTNVRKHAPGACVTVELFEDGPDVGVTVTNSRPAEPALPLPGGRLGLVGLHERAELLHGSLESGPRPDGGFRVRMRLPAYAG
ncbi:sensor histidine kinase [Actinoplanes sp. NPDC020271]|uniref:sensor histidine kinase n=1 Tax=Actinoplanes sp. NPDC020271 TaxID=3363896 RepID=UPI00379EF934